MTFSKTIIPLFLLFVLANKVVSQGDTTFFVYNSFNESIINTLIFQGDALIPPNSSFVRLTRTDSSGQPTRNSVGRVVYAQPVNFWEEGRQASFETYIRFVVNPSADILSHVGDGFSFFIVPVDSPIPPDSIDGNFGVFDPLTGRAISAFAVEFDIAPNPWDPRYQHIGIDINSRVSRNVSRFENSVGRMVTARINYYSDTRTIIAVATYGSVTSRVSHVFDLKTILPKQVHVGISASTGSRVAFHDLHDWTFFYTLLWEENNLGKTSIAQYV